MCTPTLLTGAMDTKGQFFFFFFFFFFFSGGTVVLKPVPKPVSIEPV